MNKRDYILSYERNGKIVVDLFDYYERFIKPLDNSFSSYSYYKEKLVLCYFKEHNDINPSMGSMKHKYLKGVRICHCLGCGRSADVIRLHQIMSHQYKNITLTEDEACQEIAEIYDIPLDDVFDEEDMEQSYLRRLKRLDILSRRYTFDDYSRKLLEIRKNGVDLEAVNKECIKMIATQKKLYD